jgi:hypothetical protein
MPAFIEKYYVGKASGKTTPMACSDGGSATLVQANDAIAEHTHARDAGGCAGAIDESRTDDQHALGIPVRSRRRRRFGARPCEREYGERSEACGPDHEVLGFE